MPPSSRRFVYQRVSLKANDGLELYGADSLILVYKRRARYSPLTDEPHALFMKVMLPVVDNLQTRISSLMDNCSTLLTQRMSFP